MWSTLPLHIPLSGSRYSVLGLLSDHVSHVMIPLLDTPYHCTTSTQSYMTDTTIAWYSHDNVDISEFQHTVVRPVCIDITVLTYFYSTGVLEGPAQARFSLISATLAMCAPANDRPARCELFSWNVGFSRQ